MWLNLIILTVKDFKPERQVLKVCISVMLSFLGSLPAVAQPDAALTPVQYQSSLNAMKSLLLSSMSKEERSSLSDVSCIVVSRNQFDPLKVRGYIEVGTGTPIIEFSSHFCEVVHYMGVAMILNRQLKLDDFPDKYFKYLLKATAEKTYLKTPSQYLGLKKDEVDNAFSDDVVKEFNVAVSHSIFFVLAHEFAHHLKDHLALPAETSQERLAQEVEADEWAIEMCLRNNIVPMMATVSLYPLGFFENHSKSEQNSYPPVYWRIIHAAYLTDKYVKKNAGKLRSVGDNPNRYRQMTIDLIYDFADKLDGQ